MSPVKISEQRAMFNEALRGDPGEEQLSMMYENAIADGGTKFRSARAWKVNGRYRFEVKVELPTWARQHVEKMEAEAQGQASGVSTGTTLAASASDAPNRPFSPEELRLLKRLLGKVQSSDAE